MDLSGFVAALRVGGAMIYPLLLLAVIAVVVILEKAFVFSTRTRLPAPVLEILETYAFAWEDLEPRRAAAVMGCTPGTFAVRVHRGRRHLKQILASSEVDAEAAELALNERHAGAA